MCLIKPTPKTKCYGSWDAMCAPHGVTQWAGSRGQIYLANIVPIDLSPCVYFKELTSCLKFVYT